MAVEAFGPYRMISRLGAGGMGEVWRALDTRKDREVAVKVLGDWWGAEPGYAARFRREAALAARLSAPNIIPIHDYGEIDGRLFMEMPLIVGTDLDALIVHEGPLGPGRAVDVIEQVADALDAAHRAGLVHRDVKPANVLITRHRGRDFAYLIDFGIAHTSTSTKITATGSVPGTLAYMAPERFDGAGDHRGDIYALACVLHQALTGKPPFVPPTRTNSLAFYLRAHLQYPRPRPSTLDATIPQAMDDVVAQGMAMNPDERYPSAGALATAAHNALTSPGGEQAAGPTVLPRGGPERAMSATATPTRVPDSPAVPPRRPSWPWRWPLIVAAFCAAVVVGITLASPGSADRVNGATSGRSAAPVTSTPAPAASHTTVSVSGQTPWNDTGIDVTVESTLIFSAQGVIYIAGSDPGKGPEGAVGCIATGDRRNGQAPSLAPGLTCVALVGRIGDGPPFEVGRSVTMLAPSSGRLFLGINDSFFGDNSGSWTVEVSVQPHDEQPR